MHFTLESVSGLSLSTVACKWHGIRYCWDSDSGYTQDFFRELLTASVAILTCKTNFHIQIRELYVKPTKCSFIECLMNVLKCALHLVKSPLVQLFIPPGRIRLILMYFFLAIKYFHLCQKFSFFELLGCIK